ncbi:hypothetical protein AGMMS49992_26250 [Clostridia bacterium]|nr:hypothetical protein AGMMS49992_26250 [Clostridia bacterium]
MVTTTAIIDIAAASESLVPVSLTLKLDKINVFRQDGESSLTAGGERHE